MPTLKIAEFVSFNPAQPAPVMVALTALLKERVCTETGLKIRRIIRKIQEEAKIAAEERERLLDQYTVREESGERLTDGGSYVLADSAGFEAEFRRLLSAEVEFSDTLTARDLVRKERDPSGAVHEVDDLPLEVILGLGELLQDPTDTANLAD